MARGLLMRFLTLREGSIIVVTLITIAVLRDDDQQLRHRQQLQIAAAVLRPLAIMAAGQVFVMTLGEIDLSIGALYLFTPFVFWKLDRRGLPLVPAVIVALSSPCCSARSTASSSPTWASPSFVATLAMLFFLDGLTL